MVCWHGDESVLWADFARTGSDVNARNVRQTRRSAKADLPPF
jgi:hypothetical protein